MFIVFEGGEGVGKSTQIELVHKAFVDKNLPCIKTREPGGTPFAEKIRNLFKEKNTDAPVALTELYLICAARNQHMEKIIRPSLNDKKIILCDRFLDSTYVYQHFLGKLPKQLIDNLNAPILQNLLPTLTLVFHCDESIAQSRIQNEIHRTTDRLDSYTQKTHELIRGGYKKIVEEKLPYPCGKIPTRILIDASQSVENVYNQIKYTLKQQLNLAL